MFTVRETVSPTGEKARDCYTTIVQETLPATRVVHSTRQNRAYKTTKLVSTRIVRRMPANAVNNTDTQQICTGIQNQKST